jgi:hypothetical protein
MIVKSAPSLPRRFLVYTGSRRRREAETEILPAHDALRTLADLVD